MYRAFYILFVSATLFAEAPKLPTINERHDPSKESNHAEKLAQSKNEKFSEALGHLIGQQLQSLEIPLDLNAIVKGIQDEKEGTGSPLTEEECVSTLNFLMQQSLLHKKEKNLQEAETFLQNNQNKKDISSLEEGKIQFEVHKKGSGEIVQHYNHPLVRYQGHFLNGDLLSPSPIEERMSLEEILPGLSKGMIGMREGEVRTIYIHPGLGYAEQEMNHPNSLVIFEVEILKADAPFQTDDLLSSPRLHDLIPASLQ